MDGERFSLVSGCKERERRDVVFVPQTPRHMRAKHVYTQREMRREMLVRLSVVSYPGTCVFCDSVSPE